MNDAEAERRASDFLRRCALAAAADPVDHSLSPRPADLAPLLPPAAVGGSKFDADKIPVHLVPVEFVYAAARAFGFGAKKYARTVVGQPPVSGEWNWTKGIAVSRLYASVLRHLFEWFAGRTADPESGLCPLDHAAAALAMLIGTVRRRPDLDDRPSR